MKQNRTNVRKKREERKMTEVLQDGHDFEKSASKIQKVDKVLLNYNCHWERIC